jgi:DNA polymerase III subunit beta
MRTLQQAINRSTIMHLTCKQSALDEALQITNHAIPSRPTLPILSHVLLRAERGTLRLFATNLEMGINIELEAETTEDGAIALPGKLFSDFVHILPGGSVELHCPNEATTQIVGLRSQAHIKGTAPTDFPAISTIEESALSVTLDAVLLKELISQTAFAAADDESNPILNSVLLQVREKTLILAAADSYRLAVRTAELDKASDTIGDLLIPAKALRELARILPDEPIEILADSRQVFFRSATFGMVSRLTTETFPPYEKMIPAGYLTRATINTQSFVAIVRSTLMFARDNANILCVRVGEAESGLGNGQLTIEASSDEAGDSTSTIEASVEGPGIFMNFNAKYLADALAAIDTPEIALELTQPNKPGVLKPVGADAPKLLYIVMPMSIKR